MESVKAMPYKTEYNEAIVTMSVSEGILQAEYVPPDTRGAFPNDKRIKSGRHKF